MASPIEIDDSCIPPRPSRLVYVLAPGTLVRLGPDLDRALRSVVASLQAALAGSRHFATTYSLTNITIVLDYHDSSENIQPQVFRLRHKGNRLMGYPDRGLSNRIADQIHDIQRHQSNVQTPFFCMEDWRGIGPKDHQIYDDMVKASTSISAWRNFKNTLRLKGADRNVPALSVTHDQFVPGTGTKTNEEAMAHEITVDDICNFSDAVLVRFLQNARNATGNFDRLKIHGWKNVPAAKRELLGEKLRTAVKQITTAPLGMEELATRLIAVAAETDTPPRPSRGQSLALSAEPNLIEDFESACRKELIADGGPPPFPPSQLEELLNKPEPHLEATTEGLPPKQLAINRFHKS